MSVQEANERLLPLVRDAGFKAFHIGIYITSNPYRDRGMSDNDFIFRGAWEDGWKEAQKYYLIHRGKEDGEEDKGS